jgi:cobalt-precorrin-5B (C1)-methyltransferase
MRDPVSGFEYPESWVKKCNSPDRLSLAENGLGILTASGTVLVRGFTTGTTAAAACKAAILSLSGTVSSVQVHIPCGLVVDVPAGGSAGKAACVKFSGDYPSDVTAGCLFEAEAETLPEGIRFLPGDGIGRFVRDTPRYKNGEPAISPAPLDCILGAIQEGMETTGINGVQVRLRIPRGTEIAKKTLNPLVGVEGGISVLGTTGLVEPWDDHLAISMIEQVTAADNPVLTTGRIGLRYSRLLFPDRNVILIGGKIHEALEAAKGDVVLCGLPALILRFVCPGLLDGTGFGTVEEYAESGDFPRVMRETLGAFTKAYPRVRVVLVNRNGGVIGESP